MEKSGIKSPKTISHGRDAILRVRAKYSIWYKIMGGREVSRLYRVFSPKASGFYPFGDATALAGEGGVSDVVWLIQASASNHKPKDYLVMIEKNPVGI